MSNNKTNYTNIFYTIPYRNIDIHRGSDGKKRYLMPDSSISDKPVSPDWQIYTTKRNQDDTPILGAIALNDFIGIDIDNSVLWDDLFELVPSLQDTKYIAISQPIEANKGGHLLFKYNTEHANLLQQISKYLKKLQIDVQINKKVIFLATPSNKTKLLVTPPIKQLSDLTPIPEQLIGILSSRALPLLLEDKMNNQASQLTSSQHSYGLTSYGYMLAETLTPDIVAHLTPQNEYPYVVYMDDIPRGHATNWLLQVRKKLQVDPTVDFNAFSATINYIASLWSEKRGPLKQLQADIDRDYYSPDWCYDENWKSTGMIFPDYLGNTIEAFFAFDESRYLLHNRTTNDVFIYSTQTNLINAIQGLHKLKKRYKGERLLKVCKPVKLTNNPQMNSYLQETSDLNYSFFNIYKPTDLVEIVRGNLKPLNYRYPQTIMDFLEHLFIDKNNRNRMLRFLARKYRTYDYSPLYFVLAGAAGAGKGMFVHDILTAFSGNDRVYSVDFKKLDNGFNAWMERTDWLELEEAGEGYSKKDSEKLVANLKKLTGNPFLTIEKKGKDVETPIHHYITPIISTNLQTKLITDTSSNDRRLVLFRCPKPLKDITDDTSAFRQQMLDELPNFAYYLHQLDQLDDVQYSSNETWKNQDYEDYVEDTIDDTDKLIEAHSLDKLDKFIEILADNGISYEKIDSMFSCSLPGKGSRALLYNTAGTLSLSIDSLQDLAEASSLSSTMKQLFAGTKERRTFRTDDGDSFRINVLEFSKEYVALSKPNIIENSDKINL